jgi:hypothetical protein
MKKQKSSRLFRALLCSSALAGMSSQVVVGEDGVSRVGPQTTGPDPNGQDGIATTSFQDRSTIVPNSALPQYYGGEPQPLMQPQNGATWQDQLGPRVRMETRIGEMLGSEDNGGASVNVMLPFWFGSNDTMLFVDARGTATYSGGGASNLGVGLRRYDEMRDRVFGINAYWDHDDGNRRNYNQLGIGIESLGRWVDFRANAVFSTGNDREILSTTFENPVIGVGPTGLTVDRVDFQESAFSGLNAEIGVPTPLLGRYGFETHVGGYYYQADDNEDVTGVSVRNEIQISDDVRAGINVTNDDVFDTQVFATLSITIPDGRAQRWFRPKSVREKMSSRVERRNRIVTNRRTKTTTVDGTGLATVAGQPGLRSFNRVLVVDPESAAGGVGTSADPIQTFVGFSNTGAGGTLFIVNDGNLEGPTTLLNNDAAISVDYINRIGFSIATPAGALDLRTQTLDANAGQTVWRNSAGGNVITIAGDNTCVSGFVLDGSVNPGVGVNNDLIVGGGFQGFTINNNIFRNYRQAVTLSNVTGTITTDPTTSRPGILYGNYLLGTSAFAGGVGQASINGFSLTNSGVGTLDLEVGNTQYNEMVSSLAATGNLAFGNSGEDLNGNGMLDAGEDALANGMLDEGAAFTVTALNQAMINARFHENLTSLEGEVIARDTVEDVNLNRVLDAGEDTNEDLNGNLILDPNEDVNGDGFLNLGNGNGVLDIGNGNGMLDPVEQLTPGNVASEDLNMNRLLDSAEDANGNGVLDYNVDLNENGRMDRGNARGIVVTAGLAQSTINLGIVNNVLDGNIGDAIQLTADGGILNAANLIEDLNGNGILDFEDVNLDGVFDTSEDLNFDGILAVNEDLNGNGFLDIGEDLNGNGTLDTMSEDTNSNRLLDLNDDLDNDGVFDFGEDALEPDTNNNGILDGSDDLNGDTFRNLGNMNRLLEGGFLITGNGITNSGGDAIQADVLNGGDLSLLVIANSFGNSLNQSAGNAGAGLNVSGSSGTVSVQLGFLNNEDTDFDGVLDAGEDTNANGRLDVPLEIHANEFIANGTGVIFNLTGTAVGQIDAIGNTFTGTGGGILGFQINGDTTGAPITFANNSPLGIDISRLVWNIAPAGIEFNTDVLVGGPFTVLNSTEVTTGLQSVNGSTGPFVVPNLSTQLDTVFNSFNPANGILDPGEDLNANGNLDPAEDVNMNLVLDAGEDTNEDINGNFVLDAGEDANGDGFLNLGNGNGFLDPSEDLPDQLSFTIDLDMAGVPSAVLGSDLIGSVVTATFSTGQTVTGLMQADPGDPIGSIFQPMSTMIGLGSGFTVTASDTAILLPGQIRNNTISNFGGAGLSVQANDSAAVQPLTIRGNTITDNGQDATGGPRFGIDLGTNGANAQLAAALFGNTISRNAGGAFNIDAQGGTLSVTQFETNSLDANGAGVTLNATSGAAVDVRLTNNVITNSVMNGAAGTPMTSGAAISVISDVSTVTVNEIALNSITTNAGDGISLEALNAGVINVTPTEDLNQDNVLNSGEDTNEDLNGNGMLDPGEDANGDMLLNTGNGNGQLDRGIYMNLLSNNAGSSFAVTATDGTINLGTVSQNQLINSTAGTGGIRITGVNSTLAGVFTGNTINLDPVNNANAGPGFLLQSTDGTVDITVGGTNATDRNVFSRSVGAGVAVDLNGAGTATVNVINNLITDVTDDLDNNTSYDGDGISVALIGAPGTASSTVRLIQSEITGNEIGSFTNATLGLDGSGIAVQARENTAIDDLLISGNLIGQVGQDIENDHAGIELDRQDNASFNVVNPRSGQLRAVTIIDNEVTDNDGGGTTTVAGLDIDVRGGLMDDIDVEIIDNEFARNSGDGLLLTTRGDASLLTDIRGNLIENNGTVLSPVTMALGNGITVNGIETTTSDLETQGGTWISNTIRNNGGHGIQINGVTGDIIPFIIGLDGNDLTTGSSLGNTISDNGADGIEISGGGFAQINNNMVARNAGSGVDINAVAVGTQAVLVQRNSIQDNGEDGIEFQSSVSFTDANFLIAFGNAISGNQSRGIDILNQGSAVANIRIGDGTATNANTISGNIEEGIYVVNTASTTQGQGPGSANMALAADGSIMASPNMILDINRNTISGNNSITNGFAGGGLAVRVGTSGASDQFTNADGSGLGQVLNGVGSNSAGLFDGNGRINARVTDNTFDGNQGEDVLFESFVSTAAPAVTAGTWDAVMFTVTPVYEADPLARLNLVFRGNSGQSLDVTRAGASYNAAEGVFKSRLDTETPAGPFTIATRARNAQRLPGRGGDVAAPIVSLDLGVFQYSGVGASTFRIENDFETTNFLTGDTFAIDGQPIPPTFNVSPNAIPLGTLPGELGFAWDSVAPGTFQFDEPFQGLFGLP